MDKENDKENVVHIQNGILVAVKINKTNICSKMVSTV